MKIKVEIKIPGINQKNRAFYCSKCGSREVVRNFWINPNTEKAASPFFEINKDFCLKCGYTVMVSHSAMLEEIDNWQRKDLSSVRETLERYKCPTTNYPGFYAGSMAFWNSLSDADKIEVWKKHK